MKAALTRQTGIYGDDSGITGDVDELTGDVSGITGDERARGIDIAELVDRGTAAESKP